MYRIFSFSRESKATYMCLDIEAKPLPRFIKISPTVGIKGHSRLAKNVHKRYLNNFISRGSSNLYLHRFLIWSLAFSVNCLS